MIEINYTPEDWEKEFGNAAVDSINFKLNNESTATDLMEVWIQFLLLNGYQRGSIYRIMEEITSDYTEEDMMNYFVDYNSIFDSVINNASN